MVTEWDDWHPAKGPRDRPLTLCEVCGKFVEQISVHQAMAHPTADEQQRLAVKAAVHREQRRKRRERLRQRREAGNQ